MLGCMWLFFNTLTQMYRKQRQEVEQRRMNNAWFMGKGGNLQFPNKAKVCVDRTAMTIPINCHLKKTKLHAVAVESLFQS